MAPIEKLAAGEAAVIDGIALGLTAREIAERVWNAMRAAKAPPGRRKLEDGRAEKALADLRRGDPPFRVRHRYKLGGGQLDLLLKQLRSQGGGT